MCRWDRTTRADTKRTQEVKKPCILKSESLKECTVCNEYFCCYKLIYHSSHSGLSHSRYNFKIVLYNLYQHLLCIKTFLNLKWREWENTVKNGERVGIRQRVGDTRKSEELGLSVWVINIVYLCLEELKITCKIVLILSTVSF